MLPPAASRQQSLSSASAIVLRASASSVLRTTSAHAQVRGFWAWRRVRDYDSRSDPLFYRFCRYRTLKTRAKLLDKLRRRGQWDFNEHSFFSPKSIRLASHFSRPKWRYNEDCKQNKDDKNVAEDDGLELSEREKQWKSKMEAMRQRIEQDPYEAIFGKRFEPFWSPLVPSWMREEMGLSRWPKTTTSIASNSSFNASTLNQTSPAPSKTPEQPAGRPVESGRKEQKSMKIVESDAERPHGELANDSYMSKKKPADADPDSPNGQLTNYSYSSSMSWDSLTRKTRREEWDSVSRQTRRYEYDPISNRMVKTEAGETRENKPSSSLPEAGSIDSPSRASSARWESHHVPIMSSETTRQAKAVPTKTTSPTVVDRKTSVYFPSLINSSVVPSVAELPAPPILAGKDLEVLTAASIRASMGQPKRNVITADTTQTTLGQAQAYPDGKPNSSESEWDKAETQAMLVRELNILKQKKQKLLNNENSLFHIEKQKKELRMLDARIIDVSNQLTSPSPTTDVTRARESRRPSITTALLRRQLMSKYDRQPKLDSAHEQSINDQTEVQTSKHPATSTLQSSLERMASGEVAAVVELDDSAAHESTGDPIDYKPVNVPKQWERQADLLQTDRIRRTRDESTTSTQNNSLDRGASTVKQRWIDVMNSRKAAYEAQQAQKEAVTAARDAEKNAKLEKANAMLEAEVKEQKFLMQSHDNRYAHKVKSLRQELDTAYKQSNTNSEMHMDRIRKLEQELETTSSPKVARIEQERERFQHKISDLRKELDTAYKQSSINAQMQVERTQQLERELENTRKNGSEKSHLERERYVKKVKALREELDITFKQSAVQGEKHVERIRELEKELGSIRNQTTMTPVDAELQRAKRGIFVDSAKSATADSRWHKQPLHRPEVGRKQAVHELEKTAQKLRDQALVKEVREIYEGQYGTIDVNHRQGQPRPARVPAQGPQVIEVESDVDLGKALADYEKEQSYQYRKDNLEAEIAAQERKAHEGQSVMAPESSGEMRQIIASQRTMDQDIHGTRILDDAMPKLIPTEVATRSDANVEKDTVYEKQLKLQWEEPPLYKVLAHDSGNDLLSVATTSSNFTGKETPISIPEALSQLYNPARFVPHFAELQSQGYQVIYGTKDLLVFKKVQGTPTKAAKVERSPSFEDHGLVGVNPIDGTTGSLVEPNTGSFASPTGFVGDNWDSLAVKAQPTSTASTSKNSVKTEHEDTARSLQSPHENYSQPADEASELSSEGKPRIKREERVFSGGRLKQKREKRRHHHEPTQQQVKDYQQKWKSYRRRMRWALGVGLGASVVAYGVGAAAERKEVKEKERWQQILEGKMARWE